LPESAMLKLYYSLIYSNLNYGLVAWGSTYPSYTTKLQDKAIQIVTGKKWNERISPLYKILNVLPELFNL